MWLPQDEISGMPLRSMRRRSSPRPRIAGRLETVENIGVVRLQQCDIVRHPLVAEMLGVKAGLGWYLQWAQGWAAYGNMYAALVVMALMCSGLTTLLFRGRDRLLAWQKGTVRW